MCDFSLQAFNSRPAKVGDKLVTRDFGVGTRGFAAVGVLDTAVCVLPGTELAFDAPIRQSTYLWEKEHPTNVARFVQVDKNTLHAHHDALELPDGTIVKLTILLPGQTATVLQLPAAPKNDKEAEEQKRIAFVG
jgi:hypothetical protein